MTITIIQDEPRSNGIEKQAIKTDPPAKPKNTEVTNPTKSEDTVVLKKEENQDEQKPNFNIFKAGWGVIKGLFKESYALGKFFARAIFHPLQTIKEMIAGFSALFKLLLNPQELKNALQNGWGKFKSMDSTEKGEVIGRILLNCIPVPLPLLGNTWIANARFTAKMVRLAKSTTSLPKTILKILNFIKKWGLKNIFKKPVTVTCESIKIARQGFVEKMINIALKEEGIPVALAPKVKYVDLLEFSGKASSLINPTLDITSKGTLATCSTARGFIYSHAENTFYFCDHPTMLFNNGIKFTELGETIRKDIRRLGLLIHGAKSTPKAPFLASREILREAMLKEYLIPNEGYKRIDRLTKALQSTEDDLHKFCLLPETVWQTAHELKPTIKTTLRSEDIPRQFSEGRRLLEEFQLSLKPIQEMQTSLIFKILDWRLKRRKVKIKLEDFKSPAVKDIPAKPLISDSTKIAENAAVSAPSADLQSLIGKMDELSKSKMGLGLFVPPSVQNRGFIKGTYDLIIKIKELTRTSTKKYFEFKNHPFEKEVQTVIKGKSAGIPLIKSPSMHNIPRLAPKEQKPQEENNKQNGKAFSQAA